MKILLINQTFYPDPVATAQHLTDFARALIAEGYEVTVLTGRRGYAAPHPLYAARETWKKIRIVRVWPFSLGRKNRLLRILDAFLVNLAFAWYIFWLPRFDKVVCLTSPPLVAWSAVFLARSRRSEFLYWVMDINPDEAIEAGWIRKDSLQARVLEGALEQILKQSDKVVVLDRFMKDRLLAKGADPAKVYVIPPWAHTEDLEPVERESNPFREEHGLKDKFVVMYSGNHSICHSLDTLLEAARIMKGDPGVVFMFIGGGVRVQDVLEFREKHGLENIRYLPYVDREQLKYSLSAGDLHAVVMGDAYVGIVHPSKIYGIMAVNRPTLLIGQKESPMGELLEKESLGYQVEHGNAEAVVNVIRDLVKNEKWILDQIGEKLEAALRKRYSRKRLCSELIKTLTAKEGVRGPHA